jgi:hypothetical protein
MALTYFSIADSESLVFVLAGWRRQTSPSASGRSAEADLTEFFLEMQPAA